MCQSEDDASEAQALDEAQELERLTAIQKRVRERARQNPAFADAIRAAFTGFVKLHERRIAEERAQDARERVLAREVLAQGHLTDPAIGEHSPCLFVAVRGLCPKALADEIERSGRRSEASEDLEARSAAAALTALDREEAYRSVGRSEAERETHENFTWRVLVRQPIDWKEPANPQSLEPGDLARFSEADYRTIALHHLGGLADVGSTRPLVGRPPPTGNRVQDLVAYMIWRDRHPAEWDSNSDTPRSDISPRLLPASIAEQFWADVVASDDSRSAAPRTDVPVPIPALPTLSDLATAAGISNETFSRVRAAARIEVKEKGGAARNRRYTPQEVDGLIQAARDGNFLERVAMIEKWARWGTAKASK